MLEQGSPAGQNSIKKFLFAKNASVCIILAYTPPIQKNIYPHESQEKGPFWQQLTGH